MRVASFIPFVTIGALGVALAINAFTVLSSFLLYIMMAAIVVSLAWFWRNASRRVLFVFLFFVVFSFWRVAIAEQYVSSSLLPSRFSGRVFIISNPTFTARAQRFLVRSDSDHRTITVLTHPFPRFQYGDRLSLDCRRMEEDQCLFPVLRIEERGGGNRLLAQLYGFKARLVANLEAVLPAAEANIASALLTGDKGGLSQDFREHLQATGTVHVMAVSGMHIMVLFTAIMMLLRFAPLSFIARRAIAAVVLLLFTLMIGTPASALRGCIFGVVLLLAESVGRPRQMTIAIAVTAAGLLLWQPLFLFDLGFQLSFLAVIGIVYGVPILFHCLRFAPRKKFFKVVYFLILTTIAATITTTPLLAATIGRISIVGIAANLVVVPLIEPALLLTIVTALLAFLHPLLALPFGLVLYVIVQLLQLILQFAARIPFASIAVQLPSQFILFVLYALLFSVIFFLWHRLTPLQRMLSIERASS